MPTAMNPGGVDVGGDQLDATSVGSDPGSHGRTDRAGTAAEVDHDGGSPRDAGREPRGLGGEELGAAPRHEHAGLHHDPQAGELGPAEHLLEGLARHAARDEVLELARGIRSTVDLSREQRRLVHGEYAAGGAQARHDHGIGLGRRRRGRPVVGVGEGQHPRIVTAGPA